MYSIYRMSLLIDEYRTEDSVHYGINFKHDGVYVKIPHHARTLDYAQRVDHEMLFRRIHTRLRHAIKGNWIDMGAWIGDNAIPWALQNPDRVVYAIDPSPENCAFIRQLADLNDVSNVTILQKVVSDAVKQVSTSEDLSHCSFKEGTEGSCVLESTTLDILHDLGHITDIGYIHLDVEGMEMDVVLGASEILDRYQPFLSIEQHLDTDDYQKLVDYLNHKHRYRTFMIHEILPGNRLDCRNFLCFPSRVDVDVDAIVKDLGGSVLLEEMGVGIGGAVMSDAVAD